MKISIVSQPERQLGTMFDQILEAEVVYTKIIFVSAFVSLRTILRLRERLLRRVADGLLLRIVAGIDLGGTSREVLEELNRWHCETVIFHNPVARSTFHPKIYLFESATSATLIVGSNNLTDGGLYTNYEAATRYDVDLPGDADEYAELAKPLEPFLEPHGPTVRQLDEQLINRLGIMGVVPSEAQSRKYQAEWIQEQKKRSVLAEGPFSPIAIQLPPLLPASIRREESTQPPPTAQPIEADLPRPDVEQLQQPAQLQPNSILVWRKKLPRTDALQVNPGSHHVGGVRLTQARFESPEGSRIDQTTYFRQLFAEYTWEPEPGRHQDQEHAFVPMRVIVRGRHYGIRHFEISHKPSGEAGQANYTTILRWGQEFSPIVLQENLTGAILSLYEMVGTDADFLIDISDSADVQ